MSNVIPITVAYGDGIGPEIMEAVISILKESAAPLRLETVEVGERLYNKHYTSGISEDTWSQLLRTKILLKAPITTPEGGGYKSLNVTLRKNLGLFANIRPSLTYYPFIQTRYPDMDLVIIRENEEGLYAGIEYRHTPDMYESVRLISRSGSEKIIRFAFEYALKNNRKKVSCFTKDNILKFSDGIFHKVFDEVAKEYKQIETEHYIVDIASAKLASNPKQFDVIVTQNLYGDILSDVAAEIAGSVGIAGSANIGKTYAMFEAVHGSAPDIAGKGIANPSGLLNAAIMMLVYVGLGDYANLIENAWKKTIEDGIHTADMYNSNSTKKVGTKEFAKAVIENLGSQPSELAVAGYSNFDTRAVDNVHHIVNVKHVNTETNVIKKFVGVDIFVYADNSTHQILNWLLNKIEHVCPKKLTLSTISAKGLKLWPSSAVLAEIVCDHWCCRFLNEKGDEIDIGDVAELMKDLGSAGIEVIKTENLYLFNGKPGFSL